MLCLSENDREIQCYCSSDGDTRSSREDLCSSVAAAAASEDGSARAFKRGHIVTRTLSRT
jgi:hypothetical protein